MHERAPTFRNVVAVEANVQFAHRHIRTLELPDERGYALRQPHAARLDSDQNQIVNAAVALQNLV